MRRGIVIAVLAVAALAAAALWLLRPPSERPAEPGSDRTAGRDPDAPPEAASPTLGGRPPPVANTTGARPAVVSAPPARPIGFRVRGRVVGVDAIPDGTIVFVILRSHPYDVYLARGAPAADGSFEIAVPAPASEPPWLVDVGLWGPGLAAVQGRRSANRDDVVDVDLVVPEAGFRARVVGPDGRGVPALRFALMSGGSGGTWNDIPDRSKGEREETWASSPEALCVTDADGRLAVRGLSPGRYTPVSYDDRWWLEEEWPLGTGTGEGLVGARPAFRLDVDAVPADPADDPARWKPLSVSVAIVEPPRSGTDALSGTTTPIVFRGKVPDGGLAGFTAEVHVDSVDHLLGVERVAFGPGEWTKRADVALVRRPADQMGTLVVTSRLPERDGKPATITLRHIRPVSPSSFVGDSLDLRRRPDGTFVAALPLGRQRIEIHADVPLGDLLAWKGEVDVTSRVDAGVTFPVLALGRVRIAFPPDSIGKNVLVSFSRGDPLVTASWSGRAESEGVSFPFVPAGRLGVDFFGEGFLTRMTAEVVADAETTIDLSPAK